MKLNKIFISLVFLGVLFVASCTSKENSTADTVQKDVKPDAEMQVPTILFEKTKIKVADQEIEVEVALTSIQHERGLMYREALAENAGMLFIFSEERVLSFWMKNTYVDLAIAYIDANKTIIDIQEMAATAKDFQGEPPSYPSAQPAKYALEMPKGWFTKNNISVGSKVVMP